MAFSVNSRRPGLSPAQLISLSFSTFILLGALLLMLPVMHASSEPLEFLDALFTATSAVCVTGLAVVDTGGFFSRWGQVLIMLLFQVGGFGILTVGVFLALASGRRIGFSERLQLQTQINALQVGGVVRLARSLFLTVLSAELLGALLLYLRFRTLEGAGNGAFYALFHSISAFNNAGFSLYGDSLMGFVADPLVSLTICALIIVGSLGFFVIADLTGRLVSNHKRRRWRASSVGEQRGYTRAPLSLHTKLVLLSTLFLLALGFVVVLVLEWTNAATLAPLPLGAKLLASFFASVTPRTAGFNTLDYAAMSLPTILLTILFMFIGANPGSTGGGVKTVTVLVLLSNSWSNIRGHGELRMFGRRIASSTVMRASVLVFGALLVIAVALFLLTITDADKTLRDLLFEAVSAFTTSGLSLGITAELSAAGKVIIILLMYLGRVGLLTAAVALVTEDESRAINYPAEEVIIG